MEIVSATESLLNSFRECVDQVAREQIYIEMIEAKPLEELAKFQQTLITNNLPAYYAVDNGQVVGWVDISKPTNPRLAHRGFLGMGMIKDFRGKGLGTQLITKALKHAKEIGLEKVELTVYADNHPAIKLYKKVGFYEVGVVKSYRKLNGRNFDALMMDIFL